MLPNPNFLTCSAQLWATEKTDTGAIYPVQVIMDHFNKNGCPKGLVAMYDKTVSEDEIRSAINLRYSKWARADIGPGPLRIWRVEDEKFVIQLATIQDSHKETGESGHNGMKQVIYLAFSPGK